MKRFILQFLILLFTIPLVAQTDVILSGYITEDSTGVPIPNQEVNIQSDSGIGGLIYYNNVYTDDNGFYVDTIPLPVGVTNGTLIITTIDCQGIPHTETQTFDPANMNLTQDFQICYNSPSPCEADFTWTNYGTLVVQFTDLSTGTTGPWNWSFGDGTGSSAQNPLHTFSQEGYYDVTLTIGDSSSACWDMITHTVHVIDSTGGGCQAQFTYYPDSAGNSTLIHFLDLSSGDIISWFWEFGDSTFSTEQNPSHLFPANGTYYVCLTIEANNAGEICTSTWCEEVVIGNSSGCPSYFTHQNNGLSVSFMGHMVNGQQATYSWDFGDGQTGQGESIIHPYAIAGIYYVTLTTVTQDSLMCTYSSAQSITVGDSTQWNQVYGQVFTGNFPLESGMVMIFSLDTSFNFLPFIDISMVDSSGVYYFPMVPLGEYFIYAIPFLPAGYLPTYYGDVLDWENATIVSLGQPNNPYNINLIPAGSYAPGIGTINGQIYTTLKNTLVDKITMLLMNESGQAISFQLVNVDGQFVFPELDFGIYYLHAEMAGTQSDVIKVVITMEDPQIDVVMTLSGNQILSVRDAKPILEAGVVYPNPAADQAAIKINLESASLVTIELYNLTGQLAFHQTSNLSAGETTLNIPASQLRNGLYSLRIYTDSGLSLTRKLLISQ